MPSRAILECPEVATLLRALREVSAAGFLPAVGSGPPAVGATLLHALGMHAGPSGRGVWNGIQLRSYRRDLRHVPCRLNLFGKVPNWQLSRVRSSAEMLALHGYASPSGRRLNCSVSALAPNTQGLQLQVCPAEGLVWEVLTSNGRARRVVCWEIAVLERLLAAKHRTTIWVAASSQRVRCREFLRYEQADITGPPRQGVLQDLIRVGVVSVDHIISEGVGGVTERGPLFKMRHDSVCLLFPDRVTVTIVPDA